MAKRPSLFLVDGSNNVYRSYFAIRGLTNSAGLATNAVYGFTTTLRKLLKDHAPDYIAVAFDIGSAKERHEAFADYKKDRRPMPDDLAVQLPFVNEVLEGFRVPGIGEKGAKSLIQSYGSLEGVYEHLDELKPAQRKKLEEHRDKAFMSRDLARIKCDLDYAVDFDTLKLGDPDRAKLHDVFSRL